MPMRSDSEALVRAHLALLDSICEAMDAISDPRCEIIGKHEEEREL